MERNNNIYGEIISSKFTHLLSADMNVTWEEMKELLEKEMPAKKRRKWLLWFTTKAGIIVMILFSLFALAAAVYLGTRLMNHEKNISIPAEEKETNNGSIIFEEIINEQQSNQIAEIFPANKINTSALLQDANADRKAAKMSVVTGKAKINKTRLKPGHDATNVQTDNPADKIIHPDDLQLKDSTLVPGTAAQPEIVERRRAF